ncbi:MAG: phosphohistidine phosphatase SixA [Candidatus Binatia bacterium]
MDFYLVRHGEALSESIDPRRPLTGLGRDNVEQLGREAAARGVQVSEIFHSGILRAQQTAAILAEVLQPSNGISERGGLRPEDDPSYAKAELEIAARPVMLVGHLPHMGRLAGYLAYDDPDRRIIEFAPATMVCFSREDQVWKLSWVLARESN